MAEREKFMIITWTSPSLLLLFIILNYVSILIKKIITKKNKGIGIYTKNIGAN